MDIVEQAFQLTDKAWQAAGFDPRALPMPLQIVHFIDQMAFEVMQGGVLGWLINSSGKYGPETVKAFEAVGAPQCATIVRDILGFFPGGTLPAEDQERIRQILAVESIASPHWSSLGARLLTWPDDIYMLLQKFIAEHKDDFT